MDVGERLELISRHTAEVVTQSELSGILETPDPSVYIGYAPTGPMHIGHYTTIRKLVDFLEADLDVTVLIADLHAHLDDEKSPFELLEARSAYYEKAIEAMIDASGGNAEAVTFVRGTDFELDSEYSLAIYRMAAETTTSRARRAASEVVREGENPKLGGLLYPLMQSQDVAALDVDIAYGGIDQRGIYMLTRELFEDRDRAKPVCVFAPLLSGLTGEKMSASEATTTISLTDDSKTIAEKVSGAYCPAGETENNGILEYCEHLIFPVFDRQDRSFEIDRPEEYGGPLTYDTYPALEADFTNGNLHPQDLKSGVAAALDVVISPVRDRLSDRQELLETAYPEVF